MAAGARWVWLWAMAAVGCAPAPPPAQARAELVATAKAKGVSDARVLSALSTVPREEFVSAAERAHAFEDRSLPIEHGQRTTQPSLVGRMTQSLQLGPRDKVLEIGTGSGYQAAVLSTVTSEVYSVELIPELAATARARLARLGYGAVHVRTGDGYLGWPEHAPFDAIIVTCAPDHVPPPLVEQLREGGRLVIPVEAADRSQRLSVFHKEGGALVAKSVEPVHFVPLVREGQGLLRRVEPPDEQLFAFLFSLAVEIPVALLCCARSRRTVLTTLGAALVATGLTHPFAWWSITAATPALGWGAATALVEAALTAFEVVPYRWLVGVSWRRALLTSVLANVASFALGQLAWR